MNAKELLDKLEEDGWTVNREWNHAEAYIQSPYYVRCVCLESGGSSFWLAMPGRESRDNVRMALEDDIAGESALETARKLRAAMVSALCDLPHDESPQDAQEETL